MNSTLALYYDREVAVTSSDFTTALKRSGIEAGDTIMVHSDIQTFGKLGSVTSRDQFLGELLQLFQTVLGETGTMIVPSYSYSFCKNEVFHLDQTPSAVGTFSEFIRNHPKAVRSADPIFSHAGIGRKAVELLSSLSDDSFGDDSFFDRLYHSDGKLVNFGNEFDVTFLHYIEWHSDVDYRYNKRFEGNIIYPDGRIESKQVTYYVRALPEDGFDVLYDMTLLGKELERRGLLKRVRVGAGQILTTTARACFDVGIEMLSENPYAFLKKDPRLN